MKTFFTQSNLRKYNWFHSFIWDFFPRLIHFLMSRIFCSCSDHGMRAKSINHKWKKSFCLDENRTWLAIKWSLHLMAWNEVFGCMLRWKGYRNGTQPKSLNCDFYLQQKFHSANFSFNWLKKCNRKGRCLSQVASTTSFNEVVADGTILKPKSNGKSSERWKHTSALYDIDGIGDTYALCNSPCIL